MGVGARPSEAPGRKGVDLTSGFGPGQPRAATAVTCVEATAPGLPLGVGGSDLGVCTCVRRGTAIRTFRETWRLQDRAEGTFSSTCLPSAM